MSTDAITSLSLEVDDPNKRNIPSGRIYIETLDQLDSFLSRFNRANNYDNGIVKLCVGQSIYLYNSTWYIAGFDLEHNRKAEDGTVYDNGYGIMLIPYNTVGLSAGYNSTNTLDGGFMNSYANTVYIPETMNTLKNNILGDHLANRNVLLSSRVDSNGIANNYTWTTAYGTIPSVGQLNGSFHIYSTKFNDGEANYKLPIFNYRPYWTNEGSKFWTRNARGHVNGSYNYAFVIDTGCVGSIIVTDSTIYYRPLIYIR